jgi:hypothetical protein
MTDRPSDRFDDDLVAGDLGERLERFVAEAVADEAATSRSRRRWLTQMAEESATFTGVLLDLAEAATPVVLDVVGGRRHRGRVRLVGADFCLLRLDNGDDMLVAYRGIAAVRPEPGSGAPAGDRRTPVELELAEALAIAAADRPRVAALTVAGGEPVGGTLRAVGRDVVTIEGDGPQRSSVFVPIAAIAEVRVAGSIA